MKMIRLMTLDPGHFHAALVQQRMLAGLARKVHVYAPFGPDLLAHLTRLDEYNRRADTPTAWEVEVHTGSDWLVRALRHQPGNAVVLAGRAANKIDLVEQCIEAGLNVLADTPLIVDLDDLPRLEETCRQAWLRELALCEMLTERQTVTNRLTRALLADRAVFGTLQAGTAEQPTVLLECIRPQSQQVGGTPSVESVDPLASATCLTDAGIRLADLALWLGFPQRPLDYRTDVRVLDARCGPTDTTTATDHYEILCRIAGVHVRMRASWKNVSAPDAPPWQEMVWHGSRARLAVRQGSDPGDHPEIYLAVHDPEQRAEFVRALAVRLAMLGRTFPDLGLRDLGGQLQVVIPPVLRANHEDRFTAVVAEFMQRVYDPQNVPAGDSAQMLARYYLTTKGVRLAQPWPDTAVPRTSPVTDG